MNTGGGKRWRTGQSTLRENVLQALRWSKAVVVDSTKGLIVDSARSFIVDSTKNLVVDPAKGAIASFSRPPAPPSLEGTQLYQAYKVYRETTPASITTFRINNRVLDYYTSGGKRLCAEIGDENMLQVLRMAKAFIVNSLYLSGEKEFKQITLSVETMPGVSYTHRGKCGNAEIHLSGQYVDNCAPADRAALIYEITGIMIHESTHIWLLGCEPTQFPDHGESLECGLLR